MIARPETPAPDQDTVTSTFFRLSSGLAIVSADDLGDAARKAVKAASAPWA